MVMTDYFYGTKKPIMKASGAYMPFASADWLAEYNGSNFQANIKNVSPQPVSPAVVLASPINVYVNGPNVSGFVGGMENLYRITSGGYAINTGTVDGRIQVGGHTFAGGGGDTGLAIRLD
jgi:hypothetical protein